MESDREKIQRVLEGDARGFEAIVRDHQRLVFHVVARLVPNRNDQEEICQDVFVKVYQGLSRFEFASKLSTWIARIAYNTSLNYLEKKKITLYDDKISPDDPPSEFSEDLWSSHTGPDAWTMDRDMQSKLHRAIDRLPAAYRTMVTLYHLDELSYEEIGHVMNLPQGTVKSQLFRARRMLKENLLKKFREEELHP